MIGKSVAKRLLMVGMVCMVSLANADERVEGPLIAAGLWEVSTRSVVFEWEEYPNAVKVIHRDTAELVCERGMRESGVWIRDVDGALIKLGVGTSDSGVGTSSLAVYSGEFSRRYIIDYRYETFGFGLSAGASNMAGRAAAVHSRSDAARIGDCPAGMKPGETRKVEPSL
jgi:hypothetical protein